MDTLEMLSAREQLFTRIEAIIEDPDLTLDDRDALIKELCDAVCECYPCPQ